jgi:hypothetical protein
MYLFILTENLILWNQRGLLRYERVTLQPLLFIQGLIHDLTYLFYVFYDFVFDFLFVLLGTRHIRF